MTGTFPKIGLIYHEQGIPEAPHDTADVRQSFSMIKSATIIGRIPFPA
jgi:hypothetical protein